MSKQKKFPFFPVIVSLVLLLAIGASLYILYRRHTLLVSMETQRLVIQEQGNVNSLAMEKKRLEALLQQSPCEIKALISSPESGIL